MFTQTRLNAGVANDANDRLRRFIGDVDRQLSAMIRMIVRDEDLPRFDTRRAEILLKGEDRAETDVNQKNTFAGRTSS